MICFKVNARVNITIFSLPINKKCGLKGFYYYEKIESVVKASLFCVKTGQIRHLMWLSGAVTMGAINGAAQANSRIGAGRMRGRRTDAWEGKQST